MFCIKNNDTLKLYKGGYFTLQYVHYYVPFNVSFNVFFTKI